MRALFVLILLSAVFVAGCQSQFAHTGITDNRWLTIETKLGPMTLSSKIVYCPPNGKVCVDATDALNPDQKVKTPKLAVKRKLACWEKPECKGEGLCSTRVERRPGHVFEDACVASHDADCKRSAVCKSDGKCVARNGQCVAPE